MKHLQRHAIAHEHRAGRSECTGSTIVRAFVVGVALLIGASAGTERDASVTLPPGNTVEQWNKIAEDTVVGSGAFQNEGLHLHGL